MASASKFRFPLPMRPHLFRDNKLWKCASFHCTGYGYTWQGAWDDWNGLLTNTHNAAPADRQPLQFHLGVPSHV